MQPFAGEGPTVGGQDGGGSGDSARAPHAAGHAPLFPGRTEVRYPVMVAPNLGSRLQWHRLSMESERPLSMMMRKETVQVKPIKMITQFLLVPTS